ncbi:MAG: hypothetical protein RLZZ505_439 [Verrucomicrobiota bacterium]
MPESPHNANLQIRYALRSISVDCGRRSHSFRSDGILPGCVLFLEPPPGGVAPLNHRLMDFIPPGCFPVLDAGGILSCSRWLSAKGATPPEPVHPEIRTPAGVPAIARHALDPHFPSLPPHLRHQEPGADDRLPLACRTPLLPRRNRQRPRRITTGRRRCCGSRPPSRFPETHPLPLRFYAGIEKILFLMEPRFPSALLPMARRLRRIHRQRVGAGIGQTIHRQPRGTSPGEIISRGTHRIPQKIRRGIRGALSRLIFSNAGGISSASLRTTPPVSRRNEIRTPAGVPSDTLHPAMLPSLRDAEISSLHRPVVSLVPRSTTGYRLESLRDENSHAAIELSRARFEQKGGGE